MTQPFDHAHRGTICMENAEILARSAHQGDQVILKLGAPGIAARAQPGAFVHVRCEPTLLMRRPMSIMRAERGAGTLEILFKAHGLGTAALAKRQVGDRLSLLGPIGRPFKLTGFRPRPLLLGGGVGIPPMVYLAEHMRRLSGVTPLVLMGSEVPFPFSPRPSQRMVPGIPASVIGTMPLMEDWGIACRLASQQGYAGTFEGLVTELAQHWLDHSNVPRDQIEIFACGPTPMLKAVQRMAAQYQLPAEMSLEEFMACAVGGCAGCTVRIETTMGPAMKRVCVDGPVFEASSVVFG